MLCQVCPFLCLNVSIESKLEVLRITGPNVVFKPKYNWWWYFGNVFLSKTQSDSTALKSNFMTLHKTRSQRLSFCNTSVMLEYNSFCKVFWAFCYYPWLMEYIRAEGSMDHCLIVINHWGNRNKLSHKITLCKGRHSLCTKL